MFESLFSWVVYHPFWTALWILVSILVLFVILIIRICSRLPPFNMEEEDVEEGFYGPSPQSGQMEDRDDFSGRSP